MQARKPTKFGAKRTTGGFGGSKKVVSSTSTKKKGLATQKIDDDFDDFDDWGNDEPEEVEPAEDLTVEYVCCLPLVL